MRDRHLHIARDSALLATIYRRVEQQLVMDQQRFSWALGLKFVFYGSLSAITYTFIYITEQPGDVVLSYILYGLASILLAFNFAHDFSHNTIFRSKRLNNFCFTCIYTILGAHAAAWKERHVHAHHYAPNVENFDPDLKITKLIRVAPGSPWFWYHRYQHIYAPLAYTIYSLYWIFIKDFIILYSKSEYHERKDIKYHLIFWIQKTVYLTLTLVLPALYSGQPWLVVLAGFLLMHLVQSLFLLFTFFMTHHVESTDYPATDASGHIQTSWLMNQVKSSNDMHPFSKTANFIFGGFNNHIAHHLFPHVHHIYYPRLSRIIYGVLMENNIKPNQTTYWGGVVSHLRLLKRRGDAGEKALGNTDLEYYG